MTVPDNAIEVAAWALYERDYDPNSQMAWEEISEDARDRHRTEASFALSAVYPLIAAQALRDAASDFAEGEWVDAFIHANDDIDAVKAVDKWLTERATELTL